MVSGRSPCPKVTCCITAFNILKGQNCKDREYKGAAATAAAAAAKSLQSCLTLCDPIDGSPPGFSVPGILQARTLEWVAAPFSPPSSSKWTITTQYFRIRMNFRAGNSGS